MPGGKGRVCGACRLGVPDQGLDPVCERLLHRLEVAARLQTVGDHGAEEDEVGPDRGIGQDKLYEALDETEKLFERLAAIGEGGVHLAVDFGGDAPDDGPDEAILGTVLAAGQAAAEPCADADALERRGKVALLGDDLGGGFQQPFIGMCAALGLGPARRTLGEGHY